MTITGRSLEIVRVFTRLIGTLTTSTERWSDNSIVGVIIFFFGGGAVFGRILLHFLGDKCTEIFERKTWVYGPEINYSSMKMREFGREKIIFRSKCWLVKNMIFILTSHETV